MPNASADVQAYGSPYNFMMQSNGMVAIKPPFSFLTAYDMNTGEMLYRIPNGESYLTQQQGLTGVGSQAPRGGPVATASGLLFVGTSGDRTFRARDAATGAVLWEYKLDAATEGVPAVYEVGGREYVTIPVGGDGLFAQRGNPAPGPSRYVTVVQPVPTDYEAKQTSWGEPDFRGGWPIDHLNGRTPLQRDPAQGNRAY